MPPPATQLHTSEFHHEAQQERGKWMRRRFLAYCATFFFFGIIAGPQEVGYTPLTQGFTLSSSLWFASLLTSALLFAAAFIYTWKSPPRYQHTLRTAFWLFLLNGFFTLTLAWLALHLTKDQIITTAETEPIFIVASTLAGMLFITHLLICLFLPWTVREALKPSAILWLHLAALITIDTLFFSLPPLAAVGVLIIGLIAFTPGSFICWLRYSQFQKSFRLKFEAGRYRHLANELQQARQVHEDCLPPNIDTGPARLHYAYEPMRQIGGDVIYTHSPPHSPGQHQQPTPLTVILIDVTGHGIAAALTVNRLVGELDRVFGTNPNTTCAQALTALNQYVNLSLAKHGIFATALAATLDPANNQLHYANAGHPPALLLNPNKPPQQLDPTAMMLGAVDASIFSCDTTTLPITPGQSLVIYTDGAPEAADPNRKMLGIRGTQTLTQKAAQHSQDPTTWPEHILRNVVAYRQSPADDDTLIAVLYPTNP